MRIGFSFIFLFKLISVAVLLDSNLQVTYDISGKIHNQDNYRLISDFEQIKKDNGIYGSLETDLKTSTQLSSSSNSPSGPKYVGCEAFTGVRWHYLDKFSQYIQSSFNFLIPITRVFQIFPYHFFW